jgi:hypothetical protein
LVGSPADEVHAIAAKFRSVEVTTRLFTPRSGKFAAAPTRTASVRAVPTACAGLLKESGEQSLALPTAGVDFLPPPS